MKDNESTLGRHTVTIAALAFNAASANAPTTAPALLHEKQSIHIAAPVDKVWEVAGTFSDVTWVPAVKSSTATKGNTIGSIRTLDFGGGVTLTETLVSYDASRHRYTYRIINNAANQKTAPISDMQATISVMPADGGGSIATWNASFRRVDQSANPAPGMDDATALKQIAATLTMGLAGLKKKAESQEGTPP